MAEIDELIRRRPESLTYDRAMSLLPSYEISEEWQRKKEAGLLPEGILGMCGMLNSVWPDEKMTRDEAEWILELSEAGSMRWLAGIVVMDSNQIYGMNLIEAAKAVLQPQASA